MKQCYAFVLFFGIICASIILSPAANAQAPANDECAGATTVGPLPYSASQNTRLATPNATDPVLLCADSGRGKTVWYKYVADTTRYVLFSTVRSTPVDYDIAMALYTGACGSLVELDCNDDITPGTVRQSEILYQVVAGTTYTIQIAEWKGGGPSGGVPTGGDLIFDVTVAGAPPPQVLGPRPGSLAGGAIVSTNSYEIPPVAPHVAPEEAESEKEVAAENKGEILYPTPADVMPPLGPPGSNFVKMNVPQGIQSATSRPVVMKSWTGNVPTGAIPPDPIMAVGPNHVIGCVNSNFRIWDKNGNLLKDIPMSSWFASVKSPVGFSDPQILYDEFAHRWIIGGGSFNLPYAFLISVSDDDNPLGTWYNWALPAGIGDSVTNNLPDYPQMGIDDSAIYITSREFGATTFYSRVRIIGKSQLYANTAGPVTWTDFYDFREPQHTTIALDGLRPSIIYGHPGVHYLMNSSPYSLGTFFSLWKITDPLGSPSITGVNIPVVQYSGAPQASQLGGGTVIEVSGSAIRHKPVYRDSSIWAVHSIASGPGGAYAALHYVRINPFTNTNIEDVAMGQDGYWHIYPALMVDGNKNVLLTYTRSGLTEYPGAYMAGHRNSDPPGISQSVPIKLGLAHYEALGNGRNRWGDYMGIGLDPADSSIVWMNTEYAGPSDNWGTMISKTKMAPVEGKYMSIDPIVLTFPVREVGTVGDTQSVVISSFGLDSLTVSSIAIADSNFKVASTPTLPFKLGLYDVATIKIVGSPKVLGATAGTLVISGDDPNNPTIPIGLTGEGYIINASVPGTLYASTGTAHPGGRVLTLDKLTGAATPIGQTGYDEIINVRIHPSTGELMGIATAGANNILVRINSTAADAHPVTPASMPAVSFVKGMTYHGDTLYFGRITGAVYRMNPATGVSTVALTTGLHLAGIDINPITGKLWASICPFSECGAANNDIYSIDLATGVKTKIGNAGLGSPILDIAFDANGNLFGIVGTSPSSIAVIDTATGGATIFGSLGTNDAKALAFAAGAAIPLHSFHFDSSWNLLSLPMKLDNYAKSAVFPSSSSNAFTFAGKYVSSDTLRNGIGYWLKFGGKTTFSILGAERTADTIPVVAMWNLIGSISQSIPTSLLSSSPPGLITSAYYAYTGGGYVAADTIRPGLGYWAKSTGTGSLIINPSSIEPGAATTAFTPQRRLLVLNDHG